MWKALHWTPPKTVPDWSTFLVENQVVYSFSFSNKKNPRQVLYIGGINDTLEENIKNASQLAPWFGKVYTLDHNAIGNVAEQIEVWTSLVIQLKAQGPLHIVGYSMGTFVALHLLKKFFFESCILQSPFYDAREVSWTLYCLPEWFEESVAGISLKSPTENIQVDRLYVCIRNQDTRVPKIHSEKLITELALGDRCTVLYHDGNHEFQLSDFFGPSAFL